MNARTTTQRWPWWTGAVLALALLVFAQACGQSSRSSGPSQATALQLKVRRSAEVPAGCAGTYSVSGPGVNIVNAPLPQDGNITFQGQVGATYTITVTLTCNGQTFSGSATVTVQPGVNQEEIVVTVTRVGPLTCNPSTVEPGQSATCTCSLTSPTSSPTVTWSGPVNPKTGNPVTFSSPSPGTFPVACTVNGVATAQTSVTVKEPPPPPPKDGSLRVNNPDQCGDGCGTTLLNIRIDNVVVASTLPLDRSVTKTVAAGSHQVRASCPNDGPPFEHPDSPKTVNVPESGTATVTFNSERCFLQ